ncbi:hypothetical protein Tco_0795056 [Tanacetum coccineum]
MSNSDELRHTDNTTLVPPRLPDTLPQVRTARITIPPIEPNLAEHSRISAINLDDFQLDPITLPPSPLSPFTMAAYQWMIAETDPTQREEALTETRSRIQDALGDAEDRASNAQEEARQKRKEKMAPGRRPTVNRNPPVNRSTNQNNVDINSGIDTQMLNQLIATRVAEALAAAVVTHVASTQEENNLGSNSSQNKTCNYKEFRAVMHENF